MGKDFSMLQISSDHVAAIAMKKAESGDGVILRLHELDGQTENGVHVKFAREISSAMEVNGQEQPIGPAKVEPRRSGRRHDAVYSQGVLN